MELAKFIFVSVTTVVGLCTFIKGLIEYMHANVIRRYEKFHEMSVRFDSNEDIQAVCTLLQDASAAPLTKQQKEVFICFLEEIYFMMNSGIMKSDLAFYSFGYYGKRAVDSEQFWQGLDKAEPFYIHFIDFCNQAKAYRPSLDSAREKLVY